MSIRQATPDDAALLCQLSAATFVETFGHLYPPQDLLAYLAIAYPEDLQRQQLEGGDYAAWILELDGQAAGFVFAGPCGLPHAEVQPGDLELKRLYLRRSQQNGGWGAKLFAEAEDWMRRNGPAAIWIGVWSGNEGAQRFYARHGYLKAGEYLYPVGEARDLEFILRKSLA